MDNEILLRNRSAIVFTATTWPAQMEEFCFRCGTGESVAHILGYLKDDGASAAHRGLPDYAVPTQEVNQMMENILAAQRQGKFRVCASWDCCASCLRGMAVQWTGKTDAQGMIDGLLTSDKSVTIVALWLIEPGLHGLVSTSLMAAQGRVSAKAIAQQLPYHPIQHIGKGW